VIYLKRYDLKKKRKTSIAQARGAFDHLLLLDYNIITYDRARFTYKSLRNHVQK